MVALHTEHATFYMRIWQVGEVTWGYEHSLVNMANSFLPEDQKLPELFGYFYGKEMNI